MGELTVVENVTLDGVAQAPGRPDEDTRGGFTAGGWAVEALARDPEAARAAMPAAPPAGLLFGRRTYEDLVGFWLNAPGPNPFADILRATPKYVVSSDAATSLVHPTSTLLAGDPVSTVGTLKQQVAGDLVVLGSLALVHTLAAAGLVDRYVLTHVPVVVGGGTRLFGATPTRLEVERSTTSGSGIVVATYRVLDV